MRYLASMYDARDGEDKRDRVYGLLGLTAGRDCLKVDYAITADALSKPLRLLVSMKGGLLQLSVHGS